MEVGFLNQNNSFRQQYNLNCQDEFYSKQNQTSFHQTSTNISQISDEQSESSSQSSKPNLISYYQQFGDMYNKCIDLEYNGDQQYRNEICQLRVQQNINQGLFGFDRIKLWTGMTLMNDGTLRLCSSLGSLSFNYQQQIVECVEEKKNLGVIDLHFTKNNKIHQSSIEEALHYLSKMQGIQYKEIEQELLKIYSLVKRQYDELANIKLTETELEMKDKEFKEFIDKSYDYISKNYNNQNQISMFWYSLGRIDYRDKDVQVLKTGFSKSYLELLGLNKDSLNSIFLRKQQVDLIKNQSDKIKQTLAGIDLKQRNLDTEEKQVFIQTFDGFPLVLQQKKKCFTQLIKQKSQQQLISEYFLSIIEMDVDINSLQKLIQYRLNILQNPQNLSIDEFIQKELSYQFEDIEYSIHSQSFIEKYYNENLQQILEYLKSIQKLQNWQNPCGYRLI